MVSESIQNNFWWIEDEISFHFIVKSKFEHLKKNKNFELDYRSFQNMKF